MSIDPLLELEDVRARPLGAEHEVLHGIDLRLDRAEILGVLGSSGSGKTTLLRAIVGLEPLTGGRLVLDGVDLAKVPTHRRGIGYMFQDHALFPHLDVRGNVGFGLRRDGTDRRVRDGRIDEMLDLVDLAGFGDRSISTLSGGERQRVALARSLAPAPSLVLLDEPMGSLDRALREDLVDALGRALRSTSTAAILVTHDHAEVRAMADRVAILSEGRIVQHGGIPAVEAAPVDAHVARLLGVERSLGG